MAWKIISRALELAHGRADGGIGGLLDAMRTAVGFDGSDRDGDAETGPAAVKRASFTAALIGLAAKLSKCDGVALRVEADTFEQFFPVPPEEVGNARRLFQLAARDPAGYETYAATIARALAGEPGLLRDVFDGLLHIASADGILHPAEDRFLATVAARFGYSPDRYKAMRAHFIHDADDPYVVLGLPREASASELKGRYLALVRELHPDALAAKGLAEELTRVAERKLAIVNAAWDTIARERGI